MATIDLRSQSSYSRHGLSARVLEADNGKAYLVSHLYHNAFFTVVFLLHGKLMKNRFLNCGVNTDRMLGEVRTAFGVDNYGPTLAKTELDPGISLPRQKSFKLQ